MSENSENFTVNNTIWNKIRSMKINEQWREGEGQAYIVGVLPTTELVATHATPPDANSTYAPVSEIFQNTV